MTLFLPTMGLTQIQLQSSSNQPKLSWTVVLQVGLSSSLWLEFNSVLNQAKNPNLNSIKNINSSRVSMVQVQSYAQPFKFINFRNSLSIILIQHDVNTTYELVF